MDRGKKGSEPNGTNLGSISDIGGLEAGGCLGVSRYAELWIGRAG